MKLRDYLHENRIKIAEFARKLDASRSYINMIVLEEIKPGKRLAKAIEDITEGKVTAEELLKGDKE